MTIDGDSVDSDDWVGIFNSDICVGARQWDTANCGNSGICDVPVMGDDDSEYTDGYMINGGIPSFKIFDTLFTSSNNKFTPILILGANTIAVFLDALFILDT